MHRGSSLISQSKIKEIVLSLFHYIKNENYEGYDPYDLLNSPIFRLPILRSNKKLRFYSQQIFRRIPINLRPLLGIKKELNPVTAGLCIQAFAYLLKAMPEKKDTWLNEIDYLLNKLIEVRSKGYSGYCWGYNFDWEARYATIPKYCPTIVATGIITNGLYELCKVTNNNRVEEIILSSVNFVLNDLNRTYEGDTYCLSYSPYDYQKVYNATMKGARLLTQAYTISKEEKLIKEAEKIVQFVINNQNEDGSWFYSKGDARKWVDNFHTAYVLDCLKFYCEITSNKKAEESLNKGTNYYFNNLFTVEGIPKYYSNKFYPIDSTELAQSIMTSINFKNLNIANKIVKFTINQFKTKDNRFYYRKNKIIVNKNIYIRWTAAYFFNALSYYLRNFYALD